MESQLRAYGDVLAKEFASEVPGDVMERKIGVGNVRILDRVVPLEQNRRKGLWVAAAVFALVLGAGITPAAVLSGGQSEEPVATTIEEPTPPDVDAAAWCGFGDEIGANIEAANQELSTGVAPRSKEEMSLVYVGWVESAPTDVAEATALMAQELNQHPSLFNGGTDYSNALAQVEAFREIHCDTGEISGL